ncbi:MAG: DUF3822 family protein [Flavobacteriales bacterium]|nr:DUF3822 family protein [Flavobacteriales bacterium]
MAENYNHSISNSLFLVQQLDELGYMVADKAGNVLTHGLIAAVDDEMLRANLDSRFPLNQIYSKVNLIFSGNNFACVPPIFSTNGQKKQIFETSHSLKQDESLLESSLNAEITILFSVQTKLLDAFKKQYPTLEYHHETMPFFSFTISHSTQSETAIYAKQDGENLLLLVLKDKTVLLLNQYQCGTVDDAFYFIMFTVEQLDLDNENLHLHWFENAAFSSSDTIESTFKNYIQYISIIKSNDLPHNVRMALQCV